MRRAVLFLSRFIASLWIVLAGSFLFLLLSNAPNVPHTTPFASVSINAGNSVVIHLPNKIFTCTETGQQFQCQTKIQNRLLELNLTKGNADKYFFSDCRALYDGRSIGCQKTGQTYAPILSDIYEITDLGLSPQQLQAVKQEYWGINALMQLGELRWMWISAGLSIGAGMIAALLAWMKPGKLSKAFTSLACGLGVYHLIWGFLGSVQYDVVTPYGFTPVTWGWVVDGGAIVLGAGTALATALLLWQRVNRFTRILISMGISAGIFSLCWRSLMWNSSYVLSFLGLSDNAFVQQGYPLMWLSTAISIVLAIAAAVLLGLYTHRSIKKFLCLGSGLGAVALATNFFLFVLLSLGYAD
ncbi:MAG: hypothetical protein Kow00121_35570 [Elainellaceae cyanobacterium]